MTLRSLWDRVKRTYDAWTNADAPTHGAALAYYTAFSLAPLLVIVLAVAGLVFGESAAKDELAGELKDTLGPTVAEAVQDVIANADRPEAGTIGLVIGVAVLLFGASGVFNQLQTALN